MPRQNQDHGSYVRGVAGVIPINKGGTGGQTSMEAVDNLNGLHRSTIDQANGLAMTDADGYLKAEYFSDLNIFVGPRIKGPSMLYRGCMARFQVMNYASEREVQVIIEGYRKEDLGYVAQGPYFAFKVPSEEIVTSLAINIIYDGITRQLVLPVEYPTISKPTIITSDEAAFKEVVWLEVEAPQFNGCSAFDEFSYTTPDTFRGNTNTIISGEELREEFISVTGIQQLSSPYPVSEIRIAGRLTSEDGFAYAVIDGIQYNLTNVFDEFTIKPKNSLTVEVKTSSTEEIWVAFIRPVNGNYFSGNQLYVEAVVEYANDTEGPWSLAIEPFMTRLGSSLSILIPAITYGNLYYRVMFRYVAGETELLSPYSDPVWIVVDQSSQYSLNNQTAPYVSATTNFGKSVCVHETPYGRDLFVSATLEGSGNVVFHYRVSGSSIEYLGTFTTPPHESTRLPNEEFGKEILVSEDGKYLFIAAPNAVYSDIAGTSGAVYVYERYGNRYTFIKRITDVNQLHSGFGSHMAQIGNTLIISTASSSTQAPYLYFITIQDPISTEKFTLQRVESLGEANTTNLIDFVLPRYFDIAVQNVPFLIFGIKKDIEDNEFKEFTSKYLLNPSEGTMVHTGTEFGSVITPLFDVVVNKNKYVMTYAGYNNENQLHIGYYHVIPGGTRDLMAKKWTLDRDSQEFSILPNDFAIDNFQVYIDADEISSFDVSKNLTQFYIGSSTEQVIGYPEGEPVSYLNAGMLYQLYSRVMG